MFQMKSTVRLSDTTTSFPVEPVDLNPELTLEERYENYRSLLGHEKLGNTDRAESKSKNERK